MMPPRHTRFSPPVTAMLLALWLLVAAAVAPPASGAAAGPDQPPPGGALNFEGCVKLALRQSPFLTKSSLEIEVRRLDESDSKADFLPTVNFRSRYFPQRPDAAVRRSSPDYSLEFVSDPYNPIMAYFSLKVRKILTQIATLGHLKVISESVHRLGQGFLELKSLEDQARLQEEMVQLAQEHLRYQRERQKQGEAAPLEVRIATQEAELAAAELARLKAAHTKINHALRDYLGLKPEQELHLDLSQVRRQVLGDFQPEQVGLEDARERSFDLRIQKLAEELQSWNVVLARVKLLPDFSFGVQTPDPLAGTDIRGYYVWLGVNLPLFDGFKRLRNIKRQQTILRQFASDTEVKGRDLAQKWREELDKVQSALSAARLAASQVELARLQERQGEIRYRSGGEALPVWLAARKTLLQARMQQVHKNLEADLALLSLHHFCGGLVYRFVHESQFTP
jgi:outer membrane protein TolC